MVARPDPVEIPGCCVRIARAAVVAALVVSVASVFPQAAQAVEPSSTLSAGHSLVAPVFLHPQTAASALVSRNGVFTLGVGGTSLDISENHTFPDGRSNGTVVWWQFAYPTGYDMKDRSVLRMQTDGNLVLRSSTGRKVWASNTAGSGTNNHVTMHDNGNLVMYTASGRVVWQSGTTAIMLTAGHRLKSGQQLINKYRSQFGIVPTRLVMTTGGDLALYWGATRTWHTNTHVAGSHLTLGTNGNLVIYAPNGRAVWQSLTRGRDATLAVNQCGEIDLTTFSNSAVWRRPASPTQRVCG